MTVQELQSLHAAVFAAGVRQLDLEVRGTTPDGQVAAHAPRTSALS